MNTRITVHPVIAMAAALAALGPGCSSPPSPPATTALSLVPHVFRTTDGHAYAAELGRLTVPENRDAAVSRSIDIAFVRFKSTAKTPGPPLILVEGGPGLSSIDNTRALMFPLLPTMLEAGDVITFDQRGVGLSRPTLDCPAAYDFPLSGEHSRDTLVVFARERAAACASFWTSRGVNLGAYHTYASADDIDAIRAALGADQMALLGGSYGSHLVLATIRRHGSHVARAIMNGIEGPDHTLKLPSNIQKQLDTVARLVAADAGMRQLVPDFGRLVRSVLQTLDRTPVTVEVADSGQKIAVRLSGFDLRLVTAQGLGSTTFIRRLPAAYYDMAHGDYSWLAEQVLQMSRRPFTSAMTLSMDCASGVSAGRAAQVKREAAETVLGDVVDLPFQDVCTAWPTHDLGPGFRGPLTSNVPTLFIAGTVDGRTPVSNAEEIRAGFPNSHLIVVDNAGHGDRDLLLSSPEVRQAVGSFLKGESVSLTTAALPPLEFARPVTARKPN